MWQHPSLASEVLRFCLHLFSVGGAVENFKILISSPIFAISSHTTFSHAQTGATAPLNNSYGHICNNLINE
jgi:hypothetical protein